MEVCENLVTDTNAKDLSAILKRILDHLDCLCCQIVPTFADGTAVLLKQHEAALDAARAVVVFCTEENKENTWMIKETIYLAVHFIYEQRRMRSEEKSDITEETVQRLRQETEVLLKDLRDLRKAETEHAAEQDG